MKAFDLWIQTFTSKKEVEYTENARARKVEVEKESINIETSLVQQSVNSHKSGASAKYSFKKANAKRTKTTRTSITKL